MKVGLTGNMGSGKTTVSSIFSALYIPVFHADDEAKRMYQLDEVREQVKALTGPDILDPSGQIDLKMLGNIVFSDPYILQRLIQIIHPLVREEFRKWVLRYPESPYIIHEAAIIFESEFRDEYDLVINVSCPEKIAMERIKKRDHLSEEKIRERNRFQMEDAKKASLSDFVIVNDGKTLVIPQVLKIHEELLQRSA